MTERATGISGMQKIGDNEFLVVHDNFAHEPPHLGILTIKPHSHKPGVGYTCEALLITNWPCGLAMPNDPEGICAIPGYQSEYLLAESGFYPIHGNFGRILRIRVTGSGTSRKAEYVGRFEPFAAPPENAETPPEEQVEGVECVAFDGETWLLLVQRGNKTTPGQLVWGQLTDLDSADPTFTEAGRHALTPQVVADRGAADVYAREIRPGAWEILSVASVDTKGTGDSKDLGPFRSSIYVAGIFEIVPGSKPVFTPETGFPVLWDMEGLKVEALAPPAALVPHCALSIATDDEDYWGVWRPILASPGASEFKGHLRMDTVMKSSDD